MRPIAKQFRRMVSLVLVLLGIVLSDQSHAKPLEEETPVLVKALAKQLVAKKKPKIAALDFTDIQGRPNELGRFLAEQLSVDMVLADGITVIDRANISAIMAEHQLTAEGLVNPENAKKLGQFAGVDAILIGNLAAMENLVVLTVKAISTDTAEVVAAGRMRFDLSKDVQRMLGLSVSNFGASPSSGGGGSKVTAVEGEAVATREVGPLTVVLRNVMQYSVQSKQGRVPAIRSTFDLHNRNLQRSVAIAANGKVVETGQHYLVQPNTSGWRGGAVDSSENGWLIPKEGLLGISAVYGFETASAVSFGSQVRQVNAAGVVGYIRRATYYDGKGLKTPDNPAGKYWAGSFTVIQPGKSNRITVTYVPSIFLQPQAEGPSIPSIFFQPQAKQPQAKGPSIPWPEYFQLDLELVIGTFAEGEEPEKSKDLALHNLTIDRVVLPKPDAK